MPTSPFPLPEAEGIHPQKIQRGSLVVIVIVGQLDIEVGHDDVLEAGVERTKPMESAGQADACRSPRSNDGDEVQLVYTQQSNRCSATTGRGLQMQHEKRRCQQLRQLAAVSTKTTNVG